MHTHTQDAHCTQGRASRLWEATVEGVILIPRYRFVVLDRSNITMRGLTISVRVCVCVWFKKKKLWLPENITLRGLTFTYTHIYT